MSGPSTLEVDSGELYDSSSIFSSQADSQLQLRKWPTIPHLSTRVVHDAQRREGTRTARSRPPYLQTGSTGPSEPSGFRVPAPPCARLWHGNGLVGIDLSLIQPGCAPPNCRFYVDDVESGWTYESKFDYVHGRAMAGSIKDWDSLLEQAYENLNDGGVIELQEYESVYKSDDDTVTRTPAIGMWQEKLNEAAEIINQPMNLAQTLKDRLEKAGFVDVRDDAYKIPVGPWPKDRRLKEIGYMLLFHCLEGLDAFTLAPFSRVLSWSKEDIRQLTERVKKEFLTGTNHLYVIIHFVHGRKPASTS